VIVDGLINFNIMRYLKALSILILVFLFSSCKKWSETSDGSVQIVTNKDGRTVAYDTSSGVKLLTVKGLAFKDLNRNGALDPYEDWRLSADERSKDLASS
jgi:beta-glucosidase